MKIEAHGSCVLKVWWESKAGIIEYSHICAATCPIRTYTHMHTNNSSTRGGCLKETCPPSSGSAGAWMPPRLSSLPGPRMVLPAAPVLVVSLLTGGLHRAHRPLSHHGNNSLQASSAAFRPSVCRLLAPLGRTRYWSRSWGLRAYSAVRSSYPLPPQAACGTLLFRARLGAYCVLASHGVRYGLVSI